MIITEDIKEAIRAVKGGGVIVYPTDTIYGIGCSFFSTSAIDKIYEIKQRDKSQPFSAAFNSIEQAQGYVIISQKEQETIKQKIEDKSQGWTFIVKKKSIMFLHPSFKPTLGIRIPEHKVVKAITKEAGPIITTSANISGQPAPARFEELDKEILEKVDVVVKGTCNTKKPSIIYDLTKEPYEIVRE